jgi:2-hydroxychromene-2-carboxylate isomerase
VIAESNTPVFYYDLVSPFSYLAAFRIARVLPVPVEWRPIWAAPVIAASGRDWMPTFEEGRERRAEIVRRASRYGMPDWRWPPGYAPADEEAHAAWEAPSTLAVMRLATHARDRLRAHHGRGACCPDNARNQGIVAIGDRGGGQPWGRRSTDRRDRRAAVLGR